MNTVNKQNQRYLNFVSSISPKTNEKRSLLHAFWVGGAICMVGQFIRFILQFLFGLYGDELAGVTSIILIGIGSFLTGLGVYDRIGKYAGGGSIVPITGFAHAMMSAALEYRKEGMVTGIGANMMKLAGSVIIFGVVSAWFFGLIRLLIMGA